MLPQYFAQYNMMDGGDSGWGVVMMLFWLAATVLIIVLIVRGFHWNDQADTYPKSEDPIAIAKKRYAKGDITKAEFEQIKKDLAGK